MDDDPLPLHAASADALISACVRDVFPALMHHVIVQRENDITFSEPESVQRDARALLFSQVVRLLAASRGLDSIPDAIDPRSAASLLSTASPALERLRDVDFASVPVRVLGDLYESLLELKPLPRDPWVEPDKARRKGTGIYYTPEFIVADVIGQTIGPILGARIAALRDRPASDLHKSLDFLLDFRVLDPAMGAGHFLIAAVDFIADRVTAALRPFGPQQRLPAALDPAQVKALVLQRCIFGIDIDPFATALARAALHIHVGSPSVPLTTLEFNLRSFDAIRTLGPDASQWGTYDAVIGNPPFVDSESISRQDPDLRAFARRHFDSARGNWDLYVLFVELSLRLTRPGGYTAMVTPTRLLAADYAASIQQLMLRRTLVSCCDYSAIRAFDASVPVVVAVMRNQPPPPDHKAEFVLLDADRRVRARRRVPVAMLADLPAGFIGLPLRAADPDLITAATAPHSLDTLGECFDGATTAEAYRIVEVLSDAPLEEPDPRESLRLVNTGLIDPFVLHWGRKPCRYLGLTLQRPVIRRDNLRDIAPRRLEQSEGWTVVLAGMGSRLEAAVAPPGYLAGKSTVLVLPHAGVCPFALTAALNSPFVSDVYRALFGLRALSASSMTIGPRQVARLPMPHADFFHPASIDAVSNPVSLLRLSPVDLCHAAREHNLLSLIGRHRTADPGAPIGPIDQLCDAIVKAAILDANGRSRS